MKIGGAIRVVWRDACYYPGEFDPDDPSVVPGVLLDTRGFLAREYGDFITVAQEKYFASDGGYRHAQDIPKAAIVLIEEEKCPRAKSGRRK